MVSKIKWVIKSLYFLSYIITIITLFIMTKNINGVLKGNMTPWVTGIITGLFGIVTIAPLHNKRTTFNLEYFIWFSTLILINLLMVLFSTLDIIGIKNYIVTAIIFAITPPITIASLSKIK